MRSDQESIKLRLPLILILAFSIVLTGILPSTIKTDYSIEGARILPIPFRCELWILEKPLQLEQTIALACPGVDLIRLYPLPIVQPWDDSPPIEPDKLFEGEKTLLDKAMFIQ